MFQFPDPLSEMQRIEDVPLPRVNFGSRKFTDKYAALIFLLVVVVQIGITIHWISGANSYVPSARDLDPENCESSSCYLSSFNCPNGQVKVLNFEDSSNATCIDPCEKGYLYVKRSCLKESKFDAELLQRCVNPSSETRKLQGRGDVTFSQALADTWSIIFGLCALIFVLAIIWSFFTTHYTAITIWTTLFIQLAAGLSIGFVSVAYGHTYPFLIAMGISIFSAVIIFWKRKEISDTASLLAEACSSLRENRSAFGWSALVLFFYFGYTSFIAYGVFEAIDSVELSSSCFVVIKDTGFTSVFNIIAFTWVTNVSEQIRQGIVGGAVSIGFFHANDSERPQHPVRASFKWAITTSFGTHCFAAVFGAIADNLQRLSQNFFFLYSNPIGWFVLCVTTIFKSIIDTLARYATIMHVMEGENLWTSGKQTVSMLKRNFSSAFVTSIIGERVLIGAAQILSFVVGCVAYLSLMAYYHETLEGGYFVILFLIVAAYPKFCLFVTFLVIHYSSNDGFGTESWAILVAILIQCMAFLLFNYVADLVLDALTTVFVCYAIARDNQMQSEKLDYLQKLLPKSVDPSSQPIVGQSTRPPIV